MNISWRETADGIDVDQLRGFFVDWPNLPDVETHLRLLRQSGAVIIAFDEDADRVVGFVTAITDGMLAAYIPLLEVLPEWQGQGIGTELMRRMVARLDDLYMVDLLCDEELQPYYERLGFRRSQGMIIRNYSNQAGRR